MGMSEEESRLASLVHGEGRNNSAVRAIQAMMRQEFSSMRGEPQWLLDVREVAQSTLDEYYGHHGTK